MLLNVRKVTEKNSVVLSGDFNYGEVNLCAIISSKGRKGGIAYEFPLKRNQKGLI
jgi:hypothetical protein